MSKRGNKSGDFEEKIGELTGTMKALLPALENLEKRVDLTRENMATNKANIGNLKDSLGGMGKRLNDHLKIIYEKTEVIEKLETDMEIVKKNQDTRAKRWWEVTKMILAAVIGAGGTTLIGVLASKAGEIAGK